jgi:Spy/CpxP family protein refolding chaperone
LLAVIIHLICQHLCRICVASPTATAAAPASATAATATAAALRKDFTGTQAKHGGHANRHQQLIYFHSDLLL